jgi:hypothetical protein
MFQQAELRHGSPRRQLISIHAFQQQLDYSVMAIAIFIFIFVAGPDASKLQALIIINQRTQETSQHMSV